MNLHLPARPASVLPLVLIISGLLVEPASLRPTEQPVDQDHDSTFGTTSQASTTQQKHPMHLIKFQRSSSSSYYSMIITTNNNNNSASNQAKPEATCNDGSPAGFYVRLNEHSKSWVIYLQGGGFCGTEQSCRERLQRNPQLMSSHYWPRTKSVDGILSAEPKENPYLWNANHVYLPYCSSDSWSGHAHANTQESSNGLPRASFAFLGRRIIERTLESLYEELPRQLGLASARFVLLAGDSAGATGVILNLDWVAGMVESRRLELGGPPVVVRGLADSGWFLDNEPFEATLGDLGTSSGSWSISSSPELPSVDETESGRSSLQLGSDEEPDCDKQRCSPTQSIRQAWRLWNGQVPPLCAARHRREPWRCYFGYRAYPSLQTPLFVVQWLYDEAQLMVDNVSVLPTGTSGQSGADSTNWAQWDYVQRLVAELRSSLENVTALFAPSCLSHSLLLRRAWNQVHVDGFKLPHLLNSWEEQSLSSYPEVPATTVDSTSAISSLSTSRQFDNNNNNNNNNHHHHHHHYHQNYQHRLTESQLDKVSVWPSATVEPIHVRDQPAPAGGSEGRRPSTNANAHKPPRNRKRKRNNNNQTNGNRTGGSRAARKPVTSISSPQMDEGNSVAMTREDSTNSHNNNGLLHLDNVGQMSPASEQASSSQGRLSRSSISGSSDSGSPSYSDTVREDQFVVASSNGKSNHLNHHKQNHQSNLNVHRYNQQSLQRRSLQTFSASQRRGDQFRFIDSCDSPNCNRDCPMLDVNMGLGAMQF